MASSRSLAIQSRLLQEPLARESVDQLGQVFTPRPIAGLMASLFKIEGGRRYRILDAGAGTGALSEALLQRLLREGASADVVAYEVDETCHGPLRDSYKRMAVEFGRRGLSLEWEIRSEDFISGAWGERADRFDLVVTNPPYYKLRKDGPQASIAQEVVHGQPNIYGLFIALCCRLADPAGGQVVLIAPRSWLSGPYFSKVRRDVFERASAPEIVFFADRSTAFGDQEVLQETTILHLCRGREPSRTAIGRYDGEAAGWEPLFRPDWHVLQPQGPDGPVRLPETRSQLAALERLEQSKDTLATLGLDVMTGPVVAFRAKEFMVDRRANGAVPFIWMHEVKTDGLTRHPKANKPGYLRRTARSGWLMTEPLPVVLVRRFSAKEDRHRMIACAVGDEVGGEAIAVENHLNVIAGFSGPQARRLADAVAAYLNSEQVDQYMRAISGSTQINAADLRALPFPPVSALLAGR